jgi:hypothetical protein
VAGEYCPPGNSIPELGEPATAGVPATCDGVASEVATAAAITVSGGGPASRGADEEKRDSTQEATCASRAVSEPSRPFGGNS